ncbi:MAG: hypothetical protein IJS37_04940 [Bacilli bacterium]|nr:hypothetical protein [Bacilli bacterium]
MKSRVLGSVSVIALASLVLCASLFANKSVSEVMATDDTVYFRPNSQWAIGSSVNHYAAYLWKGEGTSFQDAWINLKTGTNGYYTLAPKEGFENLIFCVMKSATNSWDNVRYQTADLKINVHDADCFALYNHRAEEKKTQGAWHTLGETLPAGGGQENVAGTKNGTFYQLLVYSFADGNGDGVGDFKGIIDHLDYLKNLGISGLWLSPIQKAGSYHGYDILDYYAVNPEYEVTVDGVKYDLAKLITECHNIGIKVILDLVLNHCSYGHPWITEHPSWFTNDPAFDGMKDFNLNNSQVNAELKKIGKYWLTEYELDGYRLDAVKWLFNSGGMSSADDARNINWLTSFYNYCRTEAGRDIFMVGENYTFDSGELAYYHKPLDSSFNFNAITAASDAYENGNAKGYVTTMTNFYSNVHSQNSNARLANFLSNHDAGRFFLSNPGVEKYLFMSYLNLLSPGNSFVYYGDELNLQASVTYDNTVHSSGYEDFLHRTPMPFATGHTNMGTYLHGFSDSYRPYVSNTSVPLTGGTADSTASEIASFYTAYSEAIRAKNAAPVLYDGVISSNNIADNRLGSYVASKGGKAATVIFNASHDWITLQIDGATTSILGAASFHGRPTLESNILTIAPLSGTVLNGSHTFSVYSGSVDPGEDPDPGTGMQIYLRGSFNSWGTPSNALFQAAPKGSDYDYCLLNVYIAKGQEFKVATEDWSTVCLGYYDGNTSFGDMGDYFYEHGIENDNIKCTASGYYDFWLTKGTMYITPFKAHAASLYGSWNGWKAGLSAETLNPWNTYVIHDVPLKAGEEAQMWVQEWDGEYTCYLVLKDAADITSPAGHAFVPSSNGRNIEATVAGTYDIEVIANGWNEYGITCYYVITMSDSVPAEAINFAKSFNNQIGAACDITGNSDKDTVVAAWAAMEEAFNDLSAEAQTALKEATADSPDEDMAAFAAKYRSVYALRGTMWSLSNFLDIDVLSAFAVSPHVGQTDGRLIALLSCASIGVLLSGALVLVYRKRKA